MSIPSEAPALGGNADITGILLAAGEGTRMRPLTHFCPKPLLPFLGRPILSHILEKIRGLRLSGTGINAHHLRPALEAWVRAHAPELVLSVEDELLGSGGGARAIAAKLPRTDHYLYHNGDILSDAGLDAMIAQHRATDADVTMLVVGPEAADGSLRYSPSTQRVTRLPAHSGFVARPQDDDQAVSFGGIMLFKRAILDALPPTPAPCILRDAVTPALHAGARVMGFPHGGRWSDLGTHARWLDGLRQHAAPPFADEILPGLPEPVLLDDGESRVLFRS